MTRTLEPGSLVIADLHLDPKGDAVLDHFVAWANRLEGVPRLAILGDLFDVWVGPAQARLEGSARVLVALAALVARGTKVDVLHGNRDFLLGDVFEKLTGSTLHPTGFKARTADGLILFVHGDELCTKDRSYQRMKRVLRSRPMGWLAPRLPLSVARWAAGRIRGASKQLVPRKLPETKSMQGDACSVLATKENVDLVVCGHAHVFRDERLEGGVRWIVLDGWGGGRDALVVAKDGRLVPLRAADVVGDPLNAEPRDLDSPAMGNANTVIAIDGPAASGKSTVARSLAKTLGLTFLDTGAMYRAVTLAVLRAGVDPENGEGATRIAADLDLSFDAGGRILIAGEPGEPAIRGPEVTSAVSAVAAHSGVRSAIVPIQRRIAERTGAVAEGRDTTTVVFPNADHKFFLVASSAERARRRSVEEGAPDRQEEIRTEIERRDHLDSTRADSPLVCGEDAIRIETDDQTAEEVAEKMLGMIRSGRSL